MHLPLPWQKELRGSQLTHVSNSPLEAAVRLSKSIPRPEKIAAKEYEPAASELFDRIMLMTDNAGASDQHRALNYLIVRYTAIHSSAADAFGRSASLPAVDARLSSLSNTRKIVEVIFSNTNRN